MSDDLCDRLTALSRSEHSDLSVAAEAVDEITRLRTENAELRGAFRDLQVTLSNRMTPGLNEVDYGARDTRAGNGKG